MLEGRMRCDDCDDCNECMRVSKQSTPALAVFYPAATSQWFAVFVGVPTIWILPRRGPRHGFHQRAHFAGG